MTRSSVIFPAVVFFALGSCNPLIGTPCNSDDRTCATPIATGTTDAHGKATLTMAAFPHTTGFSGYFDISGPGTAPYLYFLSFPLSEPEAELDLLVVTPDHLASWASQISRATQDGGSQPLQLDPSRGTLAVTAGDCLRFGAAGVTLTATGIDEATLLGYDDGVKISNTATETDRSGFAIFFDTPTLTPIDVVAFSKTVNRTSSRVRVFTRSGAISYVQAYPTPQ
jgi:hypothetical protein